MRGISKMWPANCDPRGLALSQPYNCEAVHDQAIDVFEIEDGFVGLAINIEDAKQAPGRAFGRQTGSPGRQVEA